MQKGNKLSVIACLSACVSAMLGGVAAHAAVLASYTFSPVVTPPTFSASDPNVLASPVTGGAGVNLATSGGFYLSAPFMNVNRTNDTAANAYFQITIAAAPGYELDLASLALDLAAGGGAANQRGYTLKTSVTGLALTDPSLASGTLPYVRPASGGTIPTLSYDLSAPAYQDLASLTLRVYFATPGVSQNIDVDNIVFSGAASAVPEPLACAPLALAAAGLLRRRR